jgi:hypothetical protein
MGKRIMPQGLKKKTKGKLVRKTKGKLGKSKKK